MWTVYVTVDGPGGVINVEAEIIRRALEAEGILVNVENDCEEPEGTNMDEWIEKRRELRKERRGTFKDNVKLFVRHQPWGG